MTSKPFSRRGTVSQVDACLGVFAERLSTSGTWIQSRDLAAEISARVEYEVTEEMLVSIAWQARERLMAAGEVGVELYMDGYRRMTVEGQIRGLRKRIRREDNSRKRVIRDATAALNNPEVPAPERNALEEVRRVTQAAKDLAGRRASRLRPPAPEVEP